MQLANYKSTKALCSTADTANHGEHGGQNVLNKKAANKLAAFDACLRHQIF